MVRFVWLWVLCDLLIYFYMQFYSIYISYCIFFKKEIEKKIWVVEVWYFEFNICKLKKKFNIFDIWFFLYVILYYCGLNIFNVYFLLIINY